MPISKSVHTTVVSGMLICALEKTVPYEKNPFGTMDLFDDVTQNCDFLCFSLKQKFVPMNRFIVPKLVNL